MNSLAPITLFVYKRLEHTRKTISALKKNHLANESILYIFSDAPKNDDDTKNVNAVRKLIYSVTGFKEVVVPEHK